jgi:hypothetical protein
MYLSCYACDVIEMFNYIKTATIVEGMVDELEKKMLRKLPRFELSLGRYCYSNGLDRSVGSACEGGHAIAQAVSRRLPIAAARV